MVEEPAPAEEDDIMAALNKATDAMLEYDPTVMQAKKDQKIQDAMQRLKDANIKKVLPSFQDL